MRNRSFRNSVSAALLAGCAAGSLSADSRNFSFVYESGTTPAGTVEYEQWVTWKTHKQNDHGFDRLDFRHEIEIGITEHLQLAFYLSDWRYEDGSSVSDDGTDWRDFAVEGIYNFTSAVNNPVGFALYGETKFGDEILELEGKLIFDKQIGKFKIAYNLGLAAEWEGSSYEDDKGEIMQALGINYEFHPSFSLGAEMLHEQELPDWSDTPDGVLWVGPTASYRQETFWFTVTPLFQVTDVDSEADFQTRLLVGISF